MKQDEADISMVWNDKPMVLVDDINVNNHDILYWEQLKYAVALIAFTKCINLSESTRIYKCSTHKYNQYKVAFSDRTAGLDWAY